MSTYTFEKVSDLENWWGKQEPQISPHKSPSISMHLGEEWWRVCICVYMSDVLVCVNVYAYYQRFPFENLITSKEAQYLRERAPSCTLMRNETRPSHMGEITDSNGRHDKFKLETRLKRSHVRFQQCASSTERARYVLKRTRTLACPCVPSVSIRGAAFWVL